MSVRFATRRQTLPPARVRRPALVPRRAAEPAADTWQAVQAAADAQLPRYVKDVRAALVLSIDADTIAAASNAPTAEAGLAVLKPAIDAVLAGVTAAVRKHAVPVIERSTALAMAAIEGVQAARAAAEPQLVLSLDRINLEALAVAETGLSDWLATLPPEQYATAKQLLEQTIGGELDVRAFARQLRNQIGLDERSARAVGNLERNLTEQGVTQAVLDKRLSTYTDRLRRQRAERIARTETMRAANLGQLALWDSAVRNGLLDAALAHKLWIITPDDKLCPLCRVMRGDAGKVRLDQAFKTPRGMLEVPPMHPLCRCTVGLVFDDTELDASAAPLRAEAYTPLSDLHDPHAFIFTESAPKNRQKFLIKALDLISAVHGLPGPPRRIPVKSFAKTTRVHGRYSSRNFGNGQSAPESIAMRADLIGGDYYNTFIHEYGHYLHDAILTGNSGVMGLGNIDQVPALPKDFYPVLQAINDSKAYAGWQAEQAAASGSVAEWYRYMLSVKEVVARSYAQYIATMTADAEALAAVEARAGANGGGHWHTADFAPIAQAWDDFMRGRQWRRVTPAA